MSTITNSATPLAQLEIDLDRICRNYLFIKNRLGKGTDCASVVKADAYGLGAIPVALALHDAGCRDFYVAHAQEGLTLRAAFNARDANIFALHGPHGIDTHTLVTHKITPVLNSMGDIALWNEAATAHDTRLDAVIHIDTGMNRLGLNAGETDALINDKIQISRLHIRTVMSHLACADTPEHPMNKGQLDLFLRLTTELNLPAKRSFANSAGIMLGNNYHFDQVRPGAALYGINPISSTPNPLLPVVSLKARILQTRTALPDETVGYGASYRVAKETKLAIISAGYADGYLRSTQGAGSVIIDGQPCPVVGRVSMDLIAADVTHLPTPPKPGDWAEILGEHQTADDLAAQMGTIGYEALTTLGRRYARTYKGQH